MNKFYGNVLIYRYRYIHIHMEVTHHMFWTFSFVHISQGKNLLTSNTDVRGKPVTIHCIHIPRTDVGGKPVTMRCISIHQTLLNSVLRWIQR